MIENLSLALLSALIDETLFFVEFNFLVSFQFYSLSRVNILFFHTLERRASVDIKNWIRCIVKNEVFSHIFGLCALSMKLCEFNIKLSTRSTSPILFWWEIFIDWNFFPASISLSSWNNIDGWEICRTHTRTESTNPTTSWIRWKTRSISLVSPNDLFSF